MATFVTTAGDRIQGIEFPPELAGPGISQQQRQRWLQDQGLVDAAGQRVEQPATTDQEDDSDQAATDQVDMASSAEAVTALASIAGRVDAIASQVEQFSSAEQLGSLQLELQRWSAQAGRVALAHQELSALCDQCIAACEAVGRRVQEHLAQLEANQVAAQAELQAAAAEARTIAQAAASDLDRRMAAVEALAPTLIGPKGDTGNQGIPGAGTTLVDADPMATDPESFGRKFYGRRLVPGDSCLYLNASGNSVTAYRFASNGTGWERGVELIPKTELVNQPIHVTDNSRHTIAPVMNSGAGGGSTGSGERLLSNRLSTSGSTVLADSSNWAGVSDPLSGTIELELRALDGAFAGQSSVCVASFTWEARGDQWSEYALIGGMRDTFRVDLSVQRSPAMAPSSYTGTLPPGTSRLVVFAQVSLVSGAADGGTTRFSLAGSVEFNHEGKGVIYTPGSTPPQPLWIWG